MRLLSLVLITGCLPTGGPPEGTLRGTFAGAAVDVTLDADTLYWVQRRTSCATLNQDVFGLHYGGGQFNIHFQIDGGSTILGDRTFMVPQTADSKLVWFGFDPGTPQVATAKLTARIEGIVARRTGELAITFGDGSALDATYDVPFEARGERTSCGDGGDLPDD